MSGAIRAPPSSSSFARANDFFFYKRLKDVAEFTEATSLGASLTLCGVVTIALLFLMELVAFLTVSARQELILAPHSSDPITVTFNVTFPNLRCDLLTVNARDTIGNNHLNISANVHKYTIDSATGRALMRVADHPFGRQVRVLIVTGDSSRITICPLHPAAITSQEYGDEDGDFHSDGADEPEPPAGAVPLSDATFDSFIQVRSGCWAAVCPQVWLNLPPLSQCALRTLLPGLRHSDGCFRRRVVPLVSPPRTRVGGGRGGHCGCPGCQAREGGLHVALRHDHVHAQPHRRVPYHHPLQGGRGEGGCVLCMACSRLKRAPPPPLWVRQGGDVHSHVHYHGDRTAQALLDYLVAAQADDSLVTNPNADPGAQVGG
jgi:hypothetical protein